MFFFFKMLRWFACAALSAVAGVALVAIGADAAGNGKARIGAFNIKVLGKSKFAKEKVRFYHKIAKRYDLLLVQEIRDTTESVEKNLLTRSTKVRAKMMMTFMDTQSASGSDTIERAVLYVFKKSLFELKTAGWRWPNPAREIPSGSCAGTNPSSQLDLNLASTEELDALTGVGPTTAKKIADVGDTESRQLVSKSVVSAAARLVGLRCICVLPA